MTTFTVSNIERHSDASVWDYGKVSIDVAGPAYDSGGAFIGGKSDEQTDATGLVTFAGLTVGVVYTWTHADDSTENFTAGSAGTYMLDQLITTAVPAAPGSVTPGALSAAVQALSDALQTQLSGKENSVPRGGAVTGYVVTLAADGTSFQLTAGTPGAAGAGFQTLAPQSGMLLAVVDTNGRTPIYIGPTGQTFLKLDPSVVLPGAQFDAATKALIPAKGINPAVPWSIVDTNNRLIAQVTADGTFAPSKFALPANSVPLSSLAAAVQSLLFQQSTNPTVPLRVVDTNDRLILQVTADGTFAPSKFTVPANSVALAALKADATARLVDPVPDVLETVGTSPTRSLYRNSQKTGVRTAIRTTGDSYAPKLMPDGAVIFDSNVGSLWVPSTGGTPVATFTDHATIIADGDSLTAGYPPTDFTSPSTQSWPGVLQSLVAGGVSVVNAGVSGQTADEIALRQGGETVSVTVTGSSIPASGSVVCTAAQMINWQTDNGWSCVGTLAGVPGTLSRTSADDVHTLHFARTTSGSSVTASGTLPFTSTQPENTPGALHVIFAGRNDTVHDVDPVTAVVTAVQAMVNHLSPYVKEFLIVSPTTATSEVFGTLGYGTMTTIRDRLTALYPNNFYDLRHYLVTQCIYDLGITPTSGDLSNMAADTLPPSIMASSGTDTVHYSAATAAQVGHRIYEQLQSRGWVA